MAAQMLQRGDERRCDGRAYILLNELNRKHAGESEDSPPTIWQHLVLFGVFVHFGLGCRRSECWRQIICKHTRCAHAPVPWGRKFPSTLHPLSLLTPHPGLVTFWLVRALLPLRFDWSVGLALCSKLCSCGGVCSWGWRERRKMMETLRLGAGDGDRRWCVRKVKRRLEAYEEGRKDSRKKSIMDNN